MTAENVINLSSLRLRTLVMMGLDIASRPVHGSDETRSILFRGVQQAADERNAAELKLVCQALRRHIGEHPMEIFGVMEDYRSLFGEEADFRLTRAIFTSLEGRDE